MTKISFKVFLALSLILVGTSSLFATPYWTTEQISEEFARTNNSSPPNFECLERGNRSGSLDDIAYFLHYQMLCNFLVSRQFTGAGQNHGGMIEGESQGNENIIETDNTQESIRVWSQYAIWTGDTATYGNNVRMAWQYCQIFPAWQEGDGYYATHNCGWGFEAVKKYRQAYSDTSKNSYADQCATYLASHQLPFNPNSTDLGQLEPLAMGLGIGGMYSHAVYRGRQDWQNYCLNNGRNIRRWFESNTARLFNNEVWALCGGTALWGVCASLFTAYPDSGQMWIAQYGSQLDIWQPSGQWNHSFNAWYCNAQHACFEITNDSLYWNHAVYITDSLIHLDTDHDGGIPPGISFPNTDDHSWVSCYMGWMGMERIINQAPASDAQVTSFVSPNPTRPHLAGDSLRVSLRVSNIGLSSLSGMLRLTGSFTDSANFALGISRDTIITFSRRWVLADNASLPQNNPIHAAIISNSDENPSNDTLTANFDIRRGVSVSGNIYGLNPNNPIASRVEFYHEAYPDSAWLVIQSLDGQPYSNGNRHLMTGNNRIKVVPPLIYLESEQTVNLIPDIQPPQVDFHLTASDIILVDDDVNQTYESYYLTSLGQLNQNVRVWNRSVGQLPDLNDVPAVIWFTGNDDSTTILDEDYTALLNYLNEGGNLLLSGQNITDDWRHSSDFLNTVLHCNSHSFNTNVRRIRGIEGDPITDSLDITLVGSQGGANNQNSPASIDALEGSSVIFRYTGSNTDPAGVSGNYGQGSYIFLSFGLEAVSGLNNTNTRAEVIERCLDWFDLATSTDQERNLSLPNRIWLAQNYPNPFNPSTTIQFFSPLNTKKISLVVYNLLGQEISRLYEGKGTGSQVSLEWDGRNSSGISVPSGIYLYRLESSNDQITRPLYLIR